jgi:hypothetical protein
MSTAAVAMTAKRRTSRDLSAPAAHFLPPPYGLAVWTAPKGTQCPLCQRSS